MNDTIFALSSAKGRAGIAVFRISGSETLRILTKISDYKADYESRKLYLSDITDPENNTLIDKALICFFRAPKSFTGEDCAELHVHGSLAIIKILTEVLLKDIRMAEAGEFSKRAFLNEKMDLTELDGLKDLIDAETTMQHAQSIQNMSGELKKKFHFWRRDLLKIISLLESSIDFIDEDIPKSLITDAKNKVEYLISNIALHLKDYRAGQRIKEGIKTIIIGPPNVGKSSLFNYLSQKDSAIISDIEGTTRDILEKHIDIAGYPITILDTAGIRPHTLDIVELEGIKRAKKELESADLRILLLDSRSIKDKIFLDLVNKNTICLYNKVDLQDTVLTKVCGRPLIKISLLKGIGMELLQKEIVQQASNMTSSNSNIVLTRARYKNNLQNASVHLETFLQLEDPILAIEEVRLAIKCMDIITGEVHVEEILGEIFSNFCIGK